MNVINTEKTKKNGTQRGKKIGGVLKKVLLYTLTAIGIIIVLALLYKLLEFLFVLAILLIGWLGFVPRRWHR